MCADDGINGNKVYGWQLSAKHKSMSELPYALVPAAGSGCRIGQELPNNI